MAAASDGSVDAWVRAQASQSLSWLALSLWHLDVASGRMVGRLLTDPQRGRIARITDVALHLREQATELAAIAENHPRLPTHRTRLRSVDVPPLSSATGAASSRLGVEPLSLRFLSAPPADPAAPHD